MALILASPFAFIPRNINISEYPSPTPNGQPFSGFFGLTSCTNYQLSTVKSVIAEALTLSQFACLQLSTSKLPAEISVACQIVAEGSKLSPELESFIEQVVVGREQLKGAGFQYDRKAGWKKP